MVMTVVAPNAIPTILLPVKTVAIAVVIAPARMLATLFPIKIVDRSSDGLRIIKAIAFPLDPPSSISCRARSTPIDNKAASADEKNADARKHNNRANNCDDETKDSRGGFMEKSWLS